MTCMVAKYCSRLSSFSDSKIKAALAKHYQVPPQTFCKPPAAAGSEEKLSAPVVVLPASVPAVHHSSRTLGVPEPWWEGQLAEAIHRTLKKREKAFSTVKLASSQLHKRAGLIGFISEVCLQLPLATTTRHLAVLLMDHFMDRHNIMDYRLKLVALTCLLIAAKMEDRDDCTPSINHLRRLARLDNIKEYSNDTFTRMELYIMKFFAWSVSYPTAAHFIGYYNANCYQQDCIHNNLLYFPADLPFSETDFLDDITAATDSSGNDPASDCSQLECSMDDVELDLSGMECGEIDPSALSLRDQLEETTSSLLEKALQDYRFLKYPPSMVAAAAVCTARLYANVSPVWTARLESVSCYTRQALDPTVQLLLSVSNHESAPTTT